MSTRRTTRATSKQSSRGVSPAVTEADIPTPSARRSSRRAGSATPALPAIASKASTAYGTNTSVKPAALRMPEAGLDAMSTIQKLIDGPNALPAVREEDTPSDTSKARRGHHGGRDGRQASSSTPAADKSYDNESHIFGDAGLESSVVSSSELGGMAGDPEPTPNRPRTAQENQRRQQQDRIRDIAGTPVTKRARVQNADLLPAESHFSRWFSKKGDQILNVVAEICRLAMKIFALVRSPLGLILTGLGLSVLFTLLLLTLTGSLRSYRWYGPSDLRHNIGQFLPDVVAHPVTSFSPNEIKDLQRRIQAAEYDIVYLKKRPDIDPKTISHLEKMLPKEIVVKKDKKGNLEITQEFWHALDAKMRAENAYLHSELTAKPSKGSSTTDVSLAQVETIMEKSKMWDRFLHNNRAQLNTWAGEEFDSRFPEKLKDSIDQGAVASKSEFIQLIRQNWEDTQKEIKVEIRKIAKDLDGTVRNVGKAEQEAVGHTKEEIKAISADVFKTMFSTAQLEGLSKANKNVNVATSLSRVNHWSQGTGAVVNPKLTSPNYLFPSMDRWRVVRGLSWALFKPIPRPNPPEVALQRWEEHGDCWCSPSRDADGFGPSLAVIMNNYIYPDQIVIEHIPSTGSLEPGSAPKEMELLALIEDEETYHTIKRRSEYVFQEDSPAHEQHPYGFVRIATWTYDAHALNNVQSFPPQIDLSTFRGPSHTNRLILRSKNNWGGDTVGFTCLYRVRVNGEIVPRDSL